MSVINSQPLIGASGNQSTAYNLTRSLRFRSSASAYLNRTPSSAGNRSTWTYSTWIKRGKLGADQGVISTYTGTSSINTQCSFTSSDVLDFYDYDGSGFSFRLVTTQVFRDPSAWYHIVLVLDTTQSTSSNRVKMYVNGVQITAFSTATYPSLNYASADWNSNTAQRIGEVNGAYFDGYFAETHNIDGQALEPSSFGETDTATGVWKPKKYTGTYGTNGFYLKFDNLTSTSTLGNDSSGNSNTWTVNNISLTSGSTYDSMKDVPTLTDADTANYAVLNPLSVLGGASTSNANLTGNTNTTNGAAIYSTIQIPNTGKWYWELTPTSDGSNGFVGIENQVFSTGASATYQVVYYAANGEKYVNGTNSAYGATWNNNDVIAVAVDADSGTVTFYKNNTSQGVITYSVADKNMFASFRDGGSSTSMVFNVNFGQRPFAYTPPSGFKALNTFNLPTPTIGATASTQANKYFDVKTYTGTGSSLNITGLGFQPDLVWIKERNAAADHALYDAVRGVQKQLESNTTTAETTETTGLTAFNSDGFTVGALAQVNTNTDTYVAWNWDANGAGSSNTAGSITSTVSANTTAGFSIVTYTGNGSSGATVGHGLGVSPAMVIVKNRNSTQFWVVQHQSLTSITYNLYLHLTDSQQNDSQFTGKSSTVMTLSGSSSVNTNGNTYVMYCFAEVAGYSAFGSYTGNGSTDGPFIYTGFRPAFVMIKATSSVSFGSWRTFDNKRSTYNVVKEVLFPNLSDAEDTSNNWLDLTSNGFKIRQSGDGVNGNGSTYIYMAFAENPFKYSLAR